MKKAEGSVRDWGDWRGVGYMDADRLGGKENDYLGIYQLTIYANRILRPLETIKLGWSISLRKEIGRSSWSQNIYSPTGPEEPRE